MRPEYYRQNARDCLRLANTTSDPRSKVMLMDMALAWRGLADRAASNRRALTCLAVAEKVGQGSS